MIVGRWLFTVGVIAFGSWQWGWIGALGALGVAGLVNNLIWVLQGRPQLAPATAKRLFTAVAVVIIAVSTLLIGSGAIVFFFILPALLLHHWGLVWPLAVAAALVIGPVLTAAMVVGHRRGWISFED